MKVKTKWFGEVEVEDSKIITFDKGIMGFENLKKYTIIYNSEEGASQSVVWLQSVEEQSLAIPIMNPTYVMPDYDPIVEDELLHNISDDIKTADILVFVTLTVPSDLTKMTSNMKAPIIIDADTLKGCQLIADNIEYSVKYPIYDIIKNNTKKDGE